MTDVILVMILLAVSGHATRVARAISDALPAHVVSLEPADFGSIVSNAQQPLIITWQRGLLTKRFVYLCTHQGHSFVTESRSPLTLPADAKLLHAKN
ncbi:MAG: hypothetical protein JO052_03850 [Bradyrhizobium sp.]|nr:hypothetical protein [Bradyrhizobium sp.]